MRITSLVAMLEYVQLKFDSDSLVMITKTKSDVLGYLVNKSPEFHEGFRFFISKHKKLTETRFIHGWNLIVEVVTKLEYIKIYQSFFVDVNKLLKAIKKYDNPSIKSLLRINRKVNVFFGLIHNPKRLDKLEFICSNSCFEEFYLYGEHTTVTIPKCPICKESLMLHASPDLTKELFEGMFSVDLPKRS